MEVVRGWGGLCGGGCLGVQAREALGYKQIIEHLEGRGTLEEAIAQIKIRTRRYAKQQRTWLRRFKTREKSIWLNAAVESPQDLVRQAFTFIEGQAGNGPVGVCDGVD